MKCKVLKGFLDGNDKNKPYETDSIFECTEDRFKEIQSKGNYLSIEGEKVAETGDMKPEKATKQKGH